MLASLLVKAFICSLFLIVLAVVVVCWLYRTHNQEIEDSYEEAFEPESWARSHGVTVVKSVIRETTKRLKKIKRTSPSKPSSTGSDPK